VGAAIADSKAKGNPQGEAHLSVVVGIEDHHSLVASIGLCSDGMMTPDSQWAAADDYCREYSSLDLVQQLSLLQSVGFK